MVGVVTRDIDVFGRALLDWAQGGTVPEVLEREDGFTQSGAGPDVYLSAFKEWPDAERKSIRLARGRVLDVGCGAGRVALELQLEVWTSSVWTPLLWRRGRLGYVAYATCGR